MTNNIKNKMVTLFYNQPILKKYGTMKEFTLGSRGSRGDGMGSDRLVIYNLDRNEDNNNGPNTTEDKVIIPPITDPPTGDMDYLIK